jgi:hypothetical protein
MTTLTIELPDGFAEDLARYTRQHANNPAGVGASVEDLARYLLSLAETAYRRPGSWEAAALESAGIFDFDPPPLDGDEGDYDMRLTWGEATAVRLLGPLACTFSIFFLSLIPPCSLSTFLLFHLSSFLAWGT